jgi:hypothetical protein
MLMRIRHFGKLWYELAALAVINQEWWPIALVLLLLIMSFLIVVGQTATPLIYTLF